MAERPVRNYDGNFVTCYPGSNQHDEGKLNLEFNMARLVTRVTSKNFCHVKPSFELTLIRDNKGFPQIQVGKGECSINGRDIIISQVMVIDAPEKVGDFYLALHLALDPHGNVLGDQTYGVSKIFQGIYLTYYDEKPDPVTDPNILYLGSLTYDGTNITNLEEDPDKYGRIWAEDVLAKLKDWKHPDTERMILQDWIYKVPDWYVSKEGDVIYGALEFLAGRNPEIPGTPENHEDIGTGKYGIRAEAILNDNGTRSAKIHIKGPDVDINDQNKTLNILVHDNGFEANLGQSKLVSNTANSYALDLTTPNAINVTTNKTYRVLGKEEVKLSSGASNPIALLLKGNNATISKGGTDLKDEVVFGNGTLQHIIGKSIFQYGSNNLSLLGTNTTYFNVTPKTDFKDSIRVKNAIFLDNASSYGSETSFLKPTQLKLVSGSNSTDIQVGKIDLVNTTTDGGYINVKKDAKAYSKLYNSGKLELYNSTGTPKILLNGTYDVSIEQASTTNIAGTTVGSMKLVAGVVQTTGDIKASGSITATRVYNACYNDLVEFMEKANGEEKIEAGDIVFFTEEGKITKEVTNINAVAGIVSSEETYGLVLGGFGLADYEKAPIALAGRVYLNVGELEVKVGDILGIDKTGKVCIQTKWDRYSLGKATTSNINGKVYTLVR